MHFKNMAAFINNFALKMHAILFDKMPINKALLNTVNLHYTSMGMG